MVADQMVWCVLEPDAVERMRAKGFTLRLGGGTFVPPLGEILTDVLRIAIEKPEVRRLSIYRVRRPAMGRVCVRAEYAASPEGLRVTGRNDDRCAVLAMPGWPEGCSATWFDNGAEYVYEVSLRRNAL
jgi:hypothetical protein